MTIKKYQSILRNEGVNTVKTLIFMKWTRHGSDIFITFCMFLSNKRDAGENIVVENLVYHKSIEITRLFICRPLITWK